MRDQELQKSLGKQIAKYRKASRLTQEQLGDKVGLNWKTIGKIERGISFTSLGILYQISAALGRGLDELFVWAPKRKSKIEDDPSEAAIAIIREISVTERAFTVEDGARILSLLAKRKSKSSKPSSR